MEKYFKKLIKAYEKKVLTPELGEGKLKSRLLEGLEKILKNSNKKIKDKFDKPFDYESLVEQNHNNVVRIKNCLTSQEIKTYSDLAKNCYEFYLSGRHPWKNGKIYSHYLQHIRNLGRKSAQIITSHLNQRNFDFSEEYAKKVAEKSECS